MTKDSIAVISNTPNSSIFRSVGFKAYCLNDIEQIDKTIFNLAKEGCKIIYLSEEIYLSIPETLEKYAKSAYPIILPLPIDHDSTGVGDKKIKDSVEKAIGINIF